MLFSLSIALMFGCTSGSRHAPFTDTPTAGEITILADETYKPVVQVQIDTFMEIYEYAKIHVLYLPESELFKQLLTHDTFRIAIAARNLSNEERKFMEQKKMLPISTKVAEDAVALVVNKENGDTSLSYEELGEVIRGKIQTWKQLNEKGISDSIRIVFDRSGSSNARLLHDHFLGDKEFPANAFATFSNAEVVDYVEKTKGALGVISVNWISDRDDPSTTEFLSKINVVGVSLPDTSSLQIEFNRPYQAYIALKKYPLIRDVYVINNEGRTGLGTGLASFIAGDKGQRMIRLMGLLPATMPVRIIKNN